ncbi:acyclic terpene utilization AtuA family protein [Blastococcus goldschmidtiae]|uniref:Acyclic terpene utilization AtuA family protein n=1 Tax=Blastococcus goldschmidtiae TaxID=3075546 RepID=A0ABU2KA77_9ACTN|nr:acyclic terpene utilization AtuA family protein [Blastococcus sp. DSM 46792]MDT0277093.1 acyclic terpene utilization AtuA family protein [Blastococcus sp. DSM 46792]
MPEPLRIANCSGFYGDRLSAAREMVEGGPIDVLTGDWLAELTMLILARSRASRPGGGYARTFVTQMEQVMGTCLDRGIRVVANAGGLDPAGCAEAVAEVAGTLGLSPTIAYVSGDDLLPRLDELVAAGVDLAHLGTGAPLGDPSRFISANAYLGCWGIVDALTAGADIVITGRTTDAAIVCGPAAWHHGWARDDWDALAGAVVAGHVIECGTQATGGNYSFFTEVPGMARTGFPWAEIAGDGSSVIGKHDGTGGQVSIGTVTSQLLYEIGGPAYLGPDVTARFDTVALEQVAPDRVRISGARGEPPPETLKVAMNSLGGFRTDLGIALVGLDVEAKAALVEEAFWAACPYAPADFAEVTTTVVRTDKADPASNEEAVAVWRLTLKDADERKLGRSVGAAMTELALATIPGFFGVGGGGRDARPYGVYRPSLVPAGLVPQQVTVLGGPTSVVPSTAPRTPAAPVQPLPGPAAPAPAGETRRVPLGRVVGARSGDKGGDANLGVFARTDAAWAWLDGFLTSERLAELLPETAPLPVERHRLPALCALNFVVHGLLGEGVAASTRQDGQAKSLGEWLRARYADVPVALLEDGA